VSDPTASNAGGALESFHTTPALVTYFLRVNCTRKPFSDPRVRRALALAIDRTAVVAHAGPAPRAALDHVVPQGLTEYVHPESRMSHDPAAARRLLAEAGFPGGKGFPLIDYLVNVNSANLRIADEIARMLDATLGIQLRVRTVEWAEYETGTRLRDYDLCRAGWILDYPDPQDALGMWTTGSSDNRTGWSDARYDRWVRHASDVFALLDASANEVDALLGTAHDAETVRSRIQALRLAKGRERSPAAQTLRMSLLREAEAILVQEAFPVIPLFQYMTSSAVRPAVEGFHVSLVRPDGRQVPNLEGLHPLRDLYVRR
jgi:oligopeptide transport system substrate-binding protein